MSISCCANWSIVYLIIPHCLGRFVSISIPNKLYYSRVPMNLIEIHFSFSRSSVTLTGQKKIGGVIIENNNLSKKLQYYISFFFFWDKPYLITRVIHHARYDVSREREKSRSQFLTSYIIRIITSDIKSNITYERRFKFPREFPRIESKRSEVALKNRSIILSFKLFNILSRAAIWIYISNYLFITFNLINYNVNYNYKFS